MSQIPYVTRPHQWYHNRSMSSDPRYSGDNNLHVYGNHLRFFVNCSQPLTFTTLNHVLSKNHPFTPLNPAFKQPPIINPYITIILMFLSTLFKSPTVVQLMEQYIPWQSLSALLTTSFQQSSSHPYPPSSNDAGELSVGCLIHII